MRDGDNGDGLREVETLGDSLGDTVGGAVCVGDDEMLSVLDGDELSDGDSESLGVLLSEKMRVPDVLGVTDGVIDGDDENDGVIEIVGGADGVNDSVGVSERETL